MRSAMHKLMVACCLCFLISNIFWQSRSILYNTLRRGNEEVAINLNDTNCFDRNYALIRRSLNYKCWENIDRSNELQARTIPARDVLCAFETIIPRKVKSNKRPVVLGIGVHLGPAADGKQVVPCAGFDYISWEQRDKHYPGNVRSLLIHSYSNAHLKIAQRVFWNMYRNDSDLIRADIIACGFDAWHCLIFAPYNKMLVFHNVFRFDGHIAPAPKDMAELQSVLYNATRYNPDVIIAGGNVYDVIYAQHYLGSHKIVPLLSTCVYVHERLKREITRGACPRIPPNTTGYHPQEGKIAVFPKRLSPGGGKVANLIRDYLRKRNIRYEIAILAGKPRYKYCQLGIYTAVIMLPYSVMSYFGCESASLGIPMFMPTPRLYAQWERDHHIVRERKSNLRHTVIDAMIQNKRSLNYGYHANNDFDMRSLERWLGYADMYYQGAETFDSFDELYQKILNTDYGAVNLAMRKHLANVYTQARSNWNNVNRYFFNDEVGNAIPKTLEEGMALWNRKNSPPKFGHKSELKISIGNKIPWVVVEDGPRPHMLCEKGLSGHKLVVFDFNGTKKSQKTGCHVVTRSDVQQINLAKFIFAKRPKWREDQHLKQLIMLAYAQQKGATSVTLLTSNKGNNKLCALAEPYDVLVLDQSQWSQFTFTKERYWLAWVPLNQQIIAQWAQKMSKYVNQPAGVCCNGRNEARVYAPDEVSYFESYIEHWKTDEEKLFAHVLDQNIFELAVKGYTEKLDAEFYREYLVHLANCGLVWYI